MDSHRFRDIGRVAYCEICYEPDDMAIVGRAWPRRGTPSVAAGRYRMDDFGTFLAEELTAGRSGRVADASTDPRLPTADRRKWTALDIVASCSLPVIKDGQLVAYLAAQDNRPHHWTDHEIALLSDVSERTWAIVERARAEEALRKSEAKVRTLFETIDEGFCTYEVLPDERGRVTDLIYCEVNQVFEQQTTMRDVIGKRASEFLPNLEQELLDIMTAVYQTGEPVRAEQFLSDLGR